MISIAFMVGIDEKNNALTWRNAANMQETSPLIRLWIFTTDLNWRCLCRSSSRKVWPSPTFI